MQQGDRYGGAAHEQQRDHPHFVAVPMEQYAVKSLPDEKQSYHVEHNSQDAQRQTPKPIRTPRNKQFRIDRHGAS